MNWDRRGRGRKGSIKKGQEGSRRVKKSQESRREEA